MATRKPVERDKIGKKMTLLQSLKSSGMSRRALFLTLMTASLIGYGVFMSFAALANPGTGGAGQTATASTAVDYTGSSSGGGGATPGSGGCCGGGGPEVKGAAVVNGDVQEATVKVNGSYNPNVIEVKKGIPLKLTFERHSSGGCDSQISIPDIKVLEDLPTDGSVTYTIPVPNESGKTISFSCGMNMILGTIKVVD